MGAVSGIHSYPLDVEAHLSAVESPTFGAIASFIGRVRNHDPEVDGEVVALEYTAHPDAGRILAELIERCERQAAAAGAEIRIAASHRIGRLEVGGVALVACVASAHRAAAFDACRDLVEQIKIELPIWKRQLRADGTHNWVGTN